MNVAKGILIVVLTASVHQVPCAGDDSQLSVNIGHPPAVVAGLPMPCDLSVEGEGPVVSVSLLSHFNPFDIQFRSATQQYRFHPKLTDRTRISGTHEFLTATAGGVRIAHGEVHRFVMDLSNLEINVRFARGKRIVVRPDTMEPGDYEIVAENPIAVSVAQKTITLVAPNEEERRLLERIYGLDSKGSTWRSFVIHADEVLDGIRIDEFSELGRRQLQYLLLLAHLVHSDLEIRELTIPAGDVEGLWEVYRIDALLLRYEIELAAGRTLDAEVFFDPILAARPSLNYLPSRMSTHGGLIASLRRMVKERK